tara:strand:+ start:63 stop:203 length:141 start_codon:yes stop_codon:yes gene_type:complete
VIENKKRPQAHIAKQWQVGEIIKVKNLSKLIRQLLRPTIDKWKKIK